MTLSGLELRRVACEALGWKYVRHYEIGPNVVVLTAPARLPMTRPEMIYTRAEIDIFDVIATHLPAIESDPAVSEPIFIEAMKRRGLTAVMTYDDYCGIQLYDSQGEEFKPATVGINPSEARARCIVIASAQEVKPK